MRSKIFALALVALAAAAPCAAQTDADAAAHARKVIKELQTNLKDLRTKPHRPGPGETTGLNPQPEPPGRPATKMNTAVSTKPAAVTPGTAGSLNPQPEPPGKPNPGEAGALNPQPEPPGAPAPTLARMRDALDALQSDAKSLTLGADARAKFDARLKDARGALSRYGKAADAKAADAALADFSKALDAMSKLAGGS